MRIWKVSTALTWAAALVLTLGACTSTPQVTPSTSSPVNTQVNKAFCVVEKQNSQDIRAVALGKAMGEALAKPENKQVAKAVNLSVKTAEEIAGKLQEKKCKNVLSLEPGFAWALLQIARDNADMNFAVMGAVGKTDALTNVSGIDFDLREPAFLAGYAAAGVTKSGLVGAISDLETDKTAKEAGDPPGIYTPSSWANSFRLGVEYYNQFKGSGVRLAAWDQSSGEPVQVTSVQLRDQLLKLADKKVDIVFVIAPPGESGVVEGLAAKEATAIWNGQDLAAASPKLQSNVLTSTVVDPSGCVKLLLKQLQTGSVAGNDYRGTLKNSGVKLAGWGEYAPRFSDSLTAELAGIRSQIDSGKIDITKLAAHRG